MVATAVEKGDYTVGGHVKVAISFCLEQTAYAFGAQDGVEILVAVEREEVNVETIGKLAAKWQHK